jgi:GYF domain 2/Domain of unknown function (DUF4328)
MSDQWFVHSNGEQMGPYTGQQLVEYAQQGSITAETMVWAEGMAEWAPASQVPGLIPEAAAPAPAPVAAAVATTSTAWKPPGSRVAAGGAKPATAVATSSYAAQAPVGGEYPYFPVKSASFGLWLGSFAGGIGLIIISIFMIVSGAVAGARADAQGADPTAGAGTAGMGGILYLVGMVVMLVSMIFFCINLYRAWACLQPGGAQTTPGKAIGFMFIPFFNLYWVFVAINGLPKDWNRIVASYEDLKAAPKLSETTFLLYCIGIFFAPLAMIMIFPMMSQLCKGINFFASRRNPNAPTSAFSALGRR